MLLVEHSLTLAPSLSLPLPLSLSVGQARGSTRVGARSMTPTASSGNLDILSTDKTDTDKPDNAMLGTGSDTSGGAEYACS